MTKPNNLKTQIFLDSGDPSETRKALDMIGFLDGQTTNPTLVSKNPKVVERLKKGKKFSKDEILSFYKEIVQEIESIIPSGDISIEVYADSNTEAEEMIEQAEQMSFWIKNARIKLPATKEGLRAARLLSEEKIKLNITLCFSQIQAAVFYVGTLGANLPLYISPFIGRLDDNDYQGIDLVKNISKMFKQSDNHLEVLASSIRDLDHFLFCLYLKTTAMTSPLKVLTSWYEYGMKLPDRAFDRDFMDEDSFLNTKLKPIEYQEIDLTDDLLEYDISNHLTEAGITKFTTDWNQLLEKK